MIGDPVASSPVTEPCPHCGCPVADGEWFEDDEGTASCTCCALRDKCDPNDPDCTCRREDAIVQERGPFWITTGPKRLHGRRKFGPLQSRDQALYVRDLIEKDERRDDLWVVNGEDIPDAD